jgi:hypothetical protein
MLGDKCGNYSAEYSHIVCEEQPYGKGFGDWMKG